MHFATLILLLFSNISFILSSYPEYPITNLYDTACPKYTCSEEFLPNGCALRTGSSIVIAECLPNWFFFCNFINN